LVAVEHGGMEQGCPIPDANRAIADAAFGVPHFDQWLEPIKSAAAGAHDFEVKPALLEGLAERSRNLLGANTKRARIAGDVDRGAHACASLTRSSSFYSSSMP